MKTTATEGALTTAPSLWRTESRLFNAIARLDQADPELLMTEEEARDFVANFVSPEAVAERRDEFAQFLLEGEAVAAGKRTRAQELVAPIIAQAEAIERGLDAMRRSAIKVMQANKIKALTGHTFTLKLKDSRGSCIVDDEDQIPLEFMRTKEDDDLFRIIKLVGLLDQALTDMYASSDENGNELRGESLVAAVQGDARMVDAMAALSGARHDRRAVDKNLIKKEWKENGETREVTDAETGEITPAPMVPGAHNQIDTTLIVA